MQYERSLNQVLRDFKALTTSDGKKDLAPTLVYVIFEVMRSRGLEIEKGNPEMVIVAIDNQKMMRLVKYKKGTDMSEQGEAGTMQRLDYTIPSNKEISWQHIAYEIEDITPEMVAAFLRVKQDNTNRQQMCVMN